MSCRPNRITPLAVFAALLAGAAFAIGPTGPSVHSELDSLGRQAYRTLWEFHPVDATRCGFHEFDGRLGDYSPTRAAALKFKVNDFLRGNEGQSPVRVATADSSQLTANS